MDSVGIVKLADFGMAKHVCMLYVYSIDSSMPDCRVMNPLYFALHLKSPTVSFSSLKPVQRSTFARAWISCVLAHCSAGFRSIFPPVFQRKPLLDGSRGIHGIHAQHVVQLFVFAFLLFFLALRYPLGLFLFSLYSIHVRLKLLKFSYLNMSFGT